MNILGMGYVEILVVLLVAFIFLGPERMADAARKLGKAVREVRRMASELPNLDLDLDEIARPEPAPASRGGSPHQVEDSDGSASKNSPSESRPADGTPPGGDGPVAFQAQSELADLDDGNLASDERT